MRVARMVKQHLEGIITAIVNRVHNARAEGINSVIQWLKYSARGFRNRERFRNDLLPPRRPGPLSSRGPITFYPHETLKSPMSLSVGVAYGKRRILRFATAESSSALVEN